jgi:hypothetical protein
MDIEEAQKLLARSVAKRRQWRADAWEDFAFVAGYQWSEDDAARMDEAPTAPNVKQRTWEAFTLLATQVPQLITPQVAMIALDYSPFPNAMVQKLKQQAQGQAQTSAPDQVTQAEVANLNASAALKGAQAEKVRVQTHGSRSV